MPNILNQAERVGIISEIESPENIERKKESYRRYEVYRQRQDTYIQKKLEDEFGSDSARKMRKVFSINLAPKIVDEQASIYNGEPERELTNASEAEEEQVENLYAACKADTKLKKANRIFKLQNQGALYVVPKGGIVDLIPLSPHQYDVVPKEDDPESAYCYIISTFDKFSHGQPYQKANSNVFSDGLNQRIADPDDYRKNNKRYIWWSDDYHFVTDYQGNIVSFGEKLAADVENPIKKLPFIDIADPCKDFEFWVRYGSSVVDFSIDFAVILSDVANTVRLQSYAQAVLYAEEAPKEFFVGPTSILHLPLRQDAQKDPKFEFANPSPDLTSTLTMVENYLKMFLTANGIDPKLIGGTNDSVKYNSGFERLLALIERFEASKSDFDLFKSVESKVFELMVLWSNLYQGTDNLKEELQGGQIGESVKMSVEFKEPQMIQTKQEIVDEQMKLLEAGLTSKVKALSKIHNVEEDKAQELADELEPKEVNGAADVE